MHFRVNETPFQAVNQYLVRELIGAGGMGTIYRAFDIQLRRDVALKVLNTLDPTGLERFVREREITADLDHPNFVRILSMGYLSTKEGQRPFYTMPLLRGTTLAELIQRRSKADEEGARLRDEYTLSRLLQLVQQICLAMESAHARGIIHGDLKPTNVIVGTYGELYIVDLGLAKYVHSGEAAAAAADVEAGGSETDIESPAGTPFYMAPEAIFDPASADARTDIFGVGGILYYVLTGVPPRYRPLADRPPAGNAPLVGSKPADSSIDIRPTETGALNRTTEQIPQWQESTDDSKSSRDVFLRALHGVLVPPNQVAGRARVDRRGDRQERVPDVVDPAITSICMKALARKPADRYAGLRAMWQEIQQYIDGQFELILKREAADLTRAMSRQGVPAALRNYELAEQGLREKIVQKERTGRFGLEEKLDLFDLLIDKAKIYEQRGDTGAIIRSVMRAEPILETALEVLQSQHLQLLIARGTAMVEQGDFEGARSKFAWAVAKARQENLDEIQVAALRGFGVACAGLGSSADLAAGQKALEKSIALADAFDDPAPSVRGRLGLARVLLSRGKFREARKRLGEALVRAGQNAALRAETHLSLGAYHLAHGEPTPAHHQIESGLQFAREIDARNLIREGHFLLGQAYHALGDAGERVKHFRLSLQVRGLRRTDMERRLAGFYAEHKLKTDEIGLPAPAPAEAAQPARRRASATRVHSHPNRA
jgi:serine/threonine protein kinase